VPISKEKPMIASSVKAEVVKSNARSANDTGSPEVQVALLTARICARLNTTNQEELNMLTALQEILSTVAAAIVSVFETVVGSLG
jgi:hypothetical protein